MLANPYLNTVPTILGHYPTLAGLHVHHTTDNEQDSLSQQPITVQPCVSSVYLDTSDEHGQPHFHISAPIVRMRQSVFLNSSLVLQIPVQNIYCVI